MGKYRGFWMPTFEKNMEVVSEDFLIDTIIVKSISFFDAGEFDFRRNIGLKLKSGAWIFRPILEAISIGSGEFFLQFDTPINVDAQDILQVSFLGLHRLNSDAVELEWVGNKVVKATTSIIELTS